MSDINYHRSKLEECLRKVPPVINGASVQRVRRYKEWYVKAKKVLDKRTSNQQAITSLISHYEEFK